MASNGGDENIAIAVSTSSDLSGTRAARADLTALGQDATKAAQQMESASTTAAAAENTLAGATAKATQETSKLTVSASAMRDALAKTGGDLTKAAQLVAAGAAADQQATVAKHQLAQATETEKLATEELIVTDDKRLRQMGLVETAALREDAARAAAAERDLQRMGQLENAAYAEAAAREAASARSAAAAQKAEIAAAKVPGSARTAANGIGILTQAALMGQGSLAGMATAAGGAATGIASLSSNAKVAAGAAGIGALITVGVLLYETYKKAKEELGGVASPTFLAHIGGETLRQAEADLINQRRIRDQMQQEAASKATGTILDIVPNTDAYNAQKSYEVQTKNVEELEKRIAQLRQQEKLRQIELAQSARDEIANGALTLKLEQDRLAHKKDDYQLSLEANQIERQQRAAEIQAQFRHRDASGQIVELTAEEVRLRNTLLTQNNAIADAKGRQLQYDYQIALQTRTAARLQGSDSVAEQVKGRLEQIELERQAEIRKAGDAVNANIDAEQKKRALYKETARQASENARTIFQVLRDTNNSTLKAVGTFGENLRRVAIGAEAARALVRAATEGAEAVASLAMGDLRGAALHGSAAVQFGAAAALGARESLGGGGSGGGGGAGSGGGGGGGGGSTFAPRESGGGGSIVINLLTANPYGAEAINQVSYELNRSGKLNRPIYVPPTNGLMPAGA